MRKERQSQPLLAVPGLGPEKVKRTRVDWNERFLLLKSNDERFVKDTTGLVAGVDEAGRGPLAGPVVAAAVVLPSDFHAEHIDDSKRLNDLQRHKLYDEILSLAVSVSWVSISERVIDGAGILNATYMAMRDAVAALSSTPSLVLVDGREIPSLKISQAAFPKADSTFLSVAAASIVAKFIRDGLMDEAHTRYPQYGFDIHKGYSTKRHIDALLQYGPCPLHRRSFRPVREIEFMRQAKM